MWPREETACVGANEIAQTRWIRSRRDAWGINGKDRSLQIVDAENPEVASENRFSSGGEDSHYFCFGLRNEIDDKETGKERRFAWE